LRSILEHVLLETMYDLPSRNDIERVVIDENVVLKDTQPEIIMLQKQDAQDEHRQQAKSS